VIKRVHVVHNSTFNIRFSKSKSQFVWPKSSLDALWCDGGGVCDFLGGYQQKVKGQLLRGSKTETATIQFLKRLKTVLLEVTKRCWQYRYTYRVHKMRRTKRATWFGSGYLVSLTRKHNIHLVSQVVRRHIQIHNH
jgi:hypothetical protein